MARIIYYPSSLNNRSVDFESNKSIGQILYDLNISKLSLQISINGEIPDECDLDYLPKTNDVIIIKRPVFGNSPRSKQNLATIIQVIGVVVALIPGVGPALSIAILTATGVAAGLLNARAAKLALEASQEDEINLETNNFSLNSASNESRPLKPMPLPIGSMMYAPDYNAIPFTGKYDVVNTTATFYLQTWFYPGNNYNNGALLDDLTTINPEWVLMPKDYIASGFPQYDIYFAPYSLTNPNKTIAQFKTDYLADPTDFRYLFQNDYGKPIIFFHGDTTDPLYGRYDNFALLSSTYEDTNLSYSTLISLFNTVGPITSNMEHYLTESPSTNEYVRLLSVINGYYLSGVTSSTVYTGVIPILRDWLLDLNGGDFGTSFKNKSFNTYTFVPTVSPLSVTKEGKDYATHVFNFGLGDLNISERNLEKVSLTEIPSADYSPVNKDDWIIPAIGLVYQFRNQIKKISDKKLFNESSPEEPIDLEYTGNYNFIQMDGPIDYELFTFGVTGQLYQLTDSGLEDNLCRIEVQWKRSSDINWVGEQIIFISNNNTKNIYYPFTFTAGSIGGLSDGEYLQVRVRKMTLDSVNNEDKFVCDLELKDIFFYKFYPDDAPINKPLNLEGFLLKADQNLSSTTNRYAALVEAKCWVYDFDTETWSWETNRNPAFWLLYFAYGGFLNSSADGTFSYPYSPTKGWVNYPNHPDSTDILFGAGLTNEEIDLEKILEWVEFCDNKNLSIDMVLKDDTSCSDVLERIANAGRASITYYNGKLSVIYEDEEQVPTCLFGMANILAGSFSVDYTVSDPIGSVVGKFVNRDKDWDTDEVSALVPYADSDNIKKLEINLEGITEKTRAQREVNLMAARQFYQRRLYTWKVDFEGLIARRGDLSYLSHDSTQYGYSGRIKKFILESGIVKGVETASYLEDSGINHITIRYPNGTMAIFECHIDGSNIIFDESYPIEKASYYIDPTTNNTDSDYTNSMPEDFIFICGAKETPGKLVRIVSIKPDDQMNFTITAIDEDPAMWAYEYNDLYDPDPLPESFDDSEIVLKVTDVKTEKLGNGLVRLYWQGTEFIQIINQFTGLPLEANGAYSFTGGVVVLELIPNEKYTLRIEPFAIGTPYKSESKKVVVWA